MGIILDYNDLDLRKQLDKDFEPIRFSLEKTLGKIEGRTQKISLDFSIKKCEYSEDSDDVGRYKSSKDIICYEDLSIIDDMLTVTGNSKYQYYDKDEWHYAHYPSNIENIRSMLDSATLSDKEKLDIQNALNIAMFIQKYESSEIYTSN